MKTNKSRRVLLRAICIFPFKNSIESWSNAHLPALTFCLNYRQRLHICGAVYDTVERSSVRLSVCLITRPQPRCAAGLLLSAVRAGDVDRQRRQEPGDGRPPAAAPQHGPQHGAQQQMRAVSRLQPTYNSNNNNNYEVYAAVIMTIIVRVHPVYLMNAD